MHGAHPHWIHSRNARQGKGVSVIRLRIQATRYPHWGKYSGVGQFARYLDSERYRVTEHLAPDNDSGFPIPWKLLRDRLRDRVQNNGVAWYKLSDFAGEVKIMAGIAVGQADIVHFLDGEHGIQFLPDWITRLNTRRVRLVASFHQPPHLLPELLNPAVLKKLDRIVLISPSQYPYFAAHVPPEKLVTILHGIDSIFFHPPESRPTTGKFRCLTVGHWLRDWVAIAGAVERLKDHHEIEFHIVTNSTTGLEGRPNVHFHKNVNDLELRSLNQQADVILLPLTESTANNSLLEGMACGAPVISTSLLSLRTYVGPEAGILLEPNQGSQLAGAILALQADPGRRAAMGSAARARAMELAWTKITREYETLYEALLGG